MHNNNQQPDHLIKHNSLFLCVGLPGSGKSTYAKRFIMDYAEHIVYLSSDELRAKFGTGEEDQSVTPQVFNHIKQQVDFLLESGKNVLVDATNINRRNRKDTINIAKKYGAQVIAFVFVLTHDELIARNAQRGSEGGRIVPIHVIENMRNKYEPPMLEEGITHIIYV
jgi:predicted kinase